MHTYSGLFVNVQQYATSNMAAGWHTCLDKGDFRYCSPPANICPSGASPRQSIHESSSQPPTTIERESPPCPSSLHCCIFIFGWMRWHRFNKRMELNQRVDGSNVNSFFFFHECGKNEPVCNSNQPVQTFYEGPELKGQSWGPNCDCKSGFKPQIGKVEGQASWTSRDVAALFCQRWSGWEKAGWGLWVWVSGLGLCLVKGQAAEHV